MNIEKIIAGCIGVDNGGLKSNEKIVRTIKIKPEWQKIWNEYTKIKKDEENLKNKRISLKARFWSRIEEDLNCYDEMRINTKTKEIEIINKKED